MKIEVDIKKSYAFVIIGLLIVLAGGIFVIAYAPGSTTANPAVFGHSANEIEGSSGGVPNGAIMIFDSACPSGWERYVLLDGRVPRGSDVAGGTGGSDKHNHRIYVSNMANVDGGSWRNVVATPSGSYYDTTDGSSWPPYLNVTWCKKTGVSVVSPDSGIVLISGGLYGHCISGEVTGNTLASAQVVAPATWDSTIPDPVGGNCHCPSGYTITLTGREYTSPTQGRTSYYSCMKN